MRLVYWFVTALLALIVADFAVSNRAAVTLSFWPISDTLATELFVPVLLAMTFGFMVGLLVAWVWSWRVRRRARQQARRVAVLEREVTQREERRSPASGALLKGP